ncbi:MAG: hypothetical protein AAGI34_18500 [Pseudomonadota bacterium]
MDRRTRLIAEAEARAKAATDLAERRALGMALLLEQGPMGDLMGLVDPEGDLREGLKALAPGAPNLPRLDLPEVPPAPVPMPAANREVACRCAVAAELAEHRLAFAGYTASLTAWRPEAVTGLDAAVLGRTERGTCAPATAE